MPKHLIEKTPGNYIIGEEIQTRGNDEDFPTFILENGERVGVRREQVKVEIQEDVWF